MYTVIGQPRSRAFRVMWTLAELGADYDLIAAGPQSDEARAHHPSGKIPVLKTGADVLTDSVAIMSYLADVHGGLTYPSGTVKRARLDAMLHYLNEELDAGLWLISRHSFVFPEDRRVPEIIEPTKTQVAAVIDGLADRLAGPWLMGEDFTIADILAVHCMGWAFGIGIPITSDAVKDYGKRARARAGFIAAAQK